jgi:hypothetical protein
VAGLGVGWLVEVQQKVGKGRQEDKEEVSRGIRRNVCRKIEEGRNAGRQEDGKVGRWKQVLEMEGRKPGVGETGGMEGGMKVGMEEDRKAGER